MSLATFVDYIGGALVLLLVVGVPVLVLLLSRSHAKATTPESAVRNLFVTFWFGLAGLLTLPAYGAIVYITEPETWRNDGLGATFIAYPCLWILGTSVALIVLSLELNIAIYRYYNEGKTVGDVRVGTKVRSWVRRVVVLHRVIGWFRKAPLDEVINCVCPSEPESAPDKVP